MSRDDLERFKSNVYISNQEVQNLLKETDDIESFVLLMVKLGAERNYNFTTDEVKALIQDEVNRQKLKSQAEADERILNIRGESSEAYERISNIQRAAISEKQKIENSINDWKNNDIVGLSINIFLDNPILPLY